MASEKRALESEDRFVLRREWRVLHSFIVLQVEGV
jgi:hypothetical protein